MEIYEVLYTDVVGMVEEGDLIRFAWRDGDEPPYMETVWVKSLDFAQDEAIVLGYSEVLNENMEYRMHDMTEVEVLGG